MSKSKLKMLFNGLFLVLIFSLTLWLVFRGEDLGVVLEYITTARIEYVTACIACVLAYIFGESVIIYYLMLVLGYKVKFSHCSLYSFVGFFYSCITPSASGGQPMQVVTMHKDGIPVAVSSVVLAIVTITYKLVLVIVGLCVMLLRPVGIIEFLEPVKGLIWLGIGLNVFFVALLFLLVFQADLLRGIARKVFAVWHRFRPSKNLKKESLRLERAIEQYEGSAEFYRTHKHVIFHVFLICVIQRILLFLVTWFTYCSFDLTGHGPVEITGLQAMISVAADMLPLPGGMGVSETMFLEIFDPIFGSELVLPGMMISRGISYYVQLILSAIMTILSMFIIKEGRRKGRGKLC
ncbi:MAG: flippase-like domain-containing protein [Oscillospiraceae bacterium]|nr:flippase-like domain-containing protein [Oscillospiraceae bacterium]